MRIGIVSDIHGNAAGFGRALQAMGPIDELLCLGLDDLGVGQRPRAERLIEGRHPATFSCCLGCLLRGGCRVWRPRPTLRARTSHVVLA